jgi:hypothetical protein
MILNKKMMTIKQIIDSKIYKKDIEISILEKNIIELKSEIIFTEINNQNLTFVNLNSNEILTIYILLIRYNIIKENNKIIYFINFLKYQFKTIKNN